MAQQHLKGNLKLREAWPKIEANTTELYERTEPASEEKAGLMSAEDKAKLDGIEEGAQVNQNAYAKVNGMEADNPSDEVTIEGGTGITVTQNPNEKKVTITATGEATPGPHGSAHLEFGSDPIPYATETTGGLMTAEDKQRLAELEGLTGEVSELKSGTVTGVANVVTGFGADPTGVESAVAAIQSANDAIVSSGKQNAIIIPYGKFKIDSTVTINLSYVSIICFGELDATEIQDGAAFRFIGSVSMPYEQSNVRVEGIRIKGPGRSTDTVGFMFDTDAEDREGTSHVSFSYCNISHFGTGLYFGNYAYAQNFYGIDVYYCGRCVYSPSVVTDGGERLTFHGCTFFNSDIAIDINNPDSDWVFTACSIDYNMRQIKIDRSRAFLFQCHIEFRRTISSLNQIVVTGNGGAMVMKGGWLLVTGSEESHYDYIVECDSTGGGVVFEGVFMNNTQTRTGRFATGNGYVDIQNSLSYDIANNPRVLSWGANRLSDGSFEESSVVDTAIAIIGDTQPITNPTIGSNIKLETSTEHARTGSRSLKVTKVGVGQGRFMIAVPIRQFSKPGYELYYKKPGTETGTMYVVSYFATLKYNEHGIPMRGRLLLRQTDTLSFTSAPVDWTRITGGGSTRAPAWATHFLIDFNMDAIAPIELYVDDVLITEI